MTTLAVNFHLFIEKIFGAEFRNNKNLDATSGELEENCCICYAPLEGKLIGHDGKHAVHFACAQHHYEAQPKSFCCALCRHPLDTTVFAPKSQSLSSAWNQNSRVIQSILNDWSYYFTGCSFIVGKEFFLQAAIPSCVNVGGVLGVFVLRQMIRQLPHPDEIEAFKDYRMMQGLYDIIYFLICSIHCISDLLQGNILRVGMIAGIGLSTISIQTIGIIANLSHQIFFGDAPG